MDYHDLLAMFQQLRVDLPPSGVALTRFTAGHNDLELIFLDTDRFWEEREGGGFSLLVLDGIASLQVDDWRSSLSGGHLIPVAEGARVRVTADAGMPVAMLALRPKDAGRLIVIGLGETGRNAAATDAD